MHLQSPPVGLALDRLLEIHQRGWHSKILFVRYEDLAAQPKPAMQRIYTYLGVPEFKHDFENVSQVTEEDDTAFGIPGLHDIRPKVEPLQNDYLSVLGKETIRFVQSNVGWYFSTLGYQVNPV